MTDNISPLLWGKSGWIFLNSIALTYKPENKEKYRTFLQQLEFILPCVKCGENLKKNIPNIDNALESKDKLMEFLLNIRNDINIDNNMPLLTMQDNIDEIYIKNDDYYNIIIFIIIIITLILLYLFLQKCKTIKKM
jgi:hypothetical protein